MKNKRMKENVSGYYVPSKFVNEISCELMRYEPSFEFIMGVSFVLTFLSTDGKDGHIPQGVLFAKYANRLSDLIPEKGHNQNSKSIEIPFSTLKKILEAAGDDCDDSTMVAIHQLCTRGGDE